MQLFIDSYGAFLGVRNQMFWVKPRQGEARTFAVREVNAIFLTKGVRLTTDAMMLALRHEIPVLLLDAIGHPVGQVWSGQFGSIATIRKHQALFATDLQGMQWVRAVLLDKIDRQVENLGRMLESIEARSAEREAYDRSLGGMLAVQRSLQAWRYDGEAHEAIAGNFRGWEGTASRYYLAALSAFLPEGYRFAGRSKRPAHDPFNALLNYLYGILYAYVELSLMKAGLDPYTGVLHADQYKRPTLVFDCIERYRCWAEWMAFDLCVRGRLPAGAFSETERKGVWLAPPGKGVVVDAFIAYLNEKVDYRGQPRRRMTHMDLDAIRLAGRLKDFEAQIRII